MTISTLDVIYIYNCEKCYSTDLEDFSDLAGGFVHCQECGHDHEDDTKVNVE